MKHLTLSLLALSMLLILPACSNDDDPITAQYLDIVKQLPIYYEPNSNNTLIETGNSTTDEIVILNSVSEVRNYIEEDFLEAYPDYLSVDFSQYSLIVKTSPRFGYLIDTTQSDYTIVYNSYRNCWQLSETIYVTEELSDSWYVQRVALVVEKLTDSQITHAYNIRDPYEKE